MYIRNHKGKMVHFDWTIYKSEKQIYIALWKILYNIVLEDPTKINLTLINYINETKR